MIKQKVAAKNLERSKSPSTPSYGLQFNFGVFLVSFAVFTFFSRICYHFCFRNDILHTSHWLDGAASTASLISLMLDVGDPLINTYDMHNQIFKNMSSCKAKSKRLENNSTPIVSISYQELEDVIYTLKPWFPDATLDCLVPFFKNSLLELFVPDS